MAEGAHLRYILWGRHKDYYEYRQSGLLGELS